ncbi:MAG: PP0621 family protein [Pseudomonas sp.]
MGLIKLIILLLVAFALLTLWRKLKIWQGARHAPPDPQKPALMVRCSHCRLHLPQDQAVRSNEQWFCSSEHRDASAHDRAE